MELSFSEVERVVPEARGLHDGGDGGFPLLMESWEDFRKYGISTEE